MNKLIFLFITHLWITTVSAAECSRYLTGQDSIKVGFDSNLSLSQNPYLFEAPESTAQGITQITQALKTPYGPVIIRTKELEDLQIKLAVFSMDEQNMARYINAIYTSLFNPNFNDPQFLRWLQKSYEQALWFRSVDFSKPTSSYKPDFMMAKNPERLQISGIIDAQKKARISSSLAPVLFKVDLDSPGRPSEWLTVNEHVWIFRILMREPIIRKLLIKNNFFQDSTKEEINEAVFFLSAFPELFRFATKIESLGFKFKRYFLTNGPFTEGESLKLGEAEGYPIMSNMVIEKNFTDLTESSYAHISIHGDGYSEMSEFQIEDLKIKLNLEWDKFKDQYQDRFHLKDTQLVIETDMHFTLAVDQNDNTEVTALFYLHLLNKNKLFIF